MKTLNEYQDFAVSLWKTPALGNKTATIAALGIASESGEVADEMKKALQRDGEITAARRQKIIYEMGDVLYYVAILSQAIGVSLEEVAEYNRKKLVARVEAGTLLKEEGRENEKTD